MSAKRPKSRKREKRENTVTEKKSGAKRSNVAKHWQKKLKAEKEKRVKKSMDHKITLKQSWTKETDRILIKLCVDSDDRRRDKR